MAGVGFLTTARNTLKYRDSTVTDLIVVPIADNVKIWVGSMVATDTNGRAIRAGDASATGRVLGKAEVPYLPQPTSQTANPNFVYDNTFTGHSAGSLNVVIRCGIFKVFSGTAGDAVTQANLGQDVYAIDDQTVTTVSAGHVKAGRVFNIDADGGIWVAMGYFLP